jgi:hypothetical protein
MIYSVFDWNNDPLPGGTPGKGHYVYFEGPGEGLGVRPKAKRIYGDNLGHKLEDLLPELPAGSRQVGRGENPKGRIAVLNSALRAELGEVNPVVQAPWTTVLIWAGVTMGGFYLASWLGKKAARQR